MYDALRTALFKLDAEKAHILTSTAARAAQLTRADALLEGSFEFDDLRLEQKLFGHSFPNPVGLAAGFDKNAALVPFWGRLGLGFAEVGSVSALPSKGNPRPRAFRLPDDLALINRMGLNNKGARKIARRLRRYRRRREIPIGINLAKTHSPDIMGDAAVDDFRESFRLLAPLADYVALNISCPNTREGKTFEDRDALDQLLTAVMEERSEADLDVPVLVKVSPPLSDKVVFDSAIEDVVALADRHGVAGFIATNTASDREGLATDESTLREIGIGGLSGRPIEERSTHQIRYIYRLTDGRYPIIGVGGIFSAEDAYRKIKAGARLVQVYTGLVYEGPSLVRRIKKGLVELVERDGYSSITEAVGADARVEV